MAMAQPAASTSSEPNQNFPPTTATVAVAGPSGLPMGGLNENRKPLPQELMMALAQVAAPQAGPSRAEVDLLIDRKPSPHELMMALKQASEQQAGPSRAAVRLSIERKPSQYELLMQLNKATDLIRNCEPSECFLCSKMIQTSRGVVLVNCLHTFCGNCLQTSLLEHATVRCPYPYGQFECDGTLEDREIESLLGPEEYKGFLQRQFEVYQTDEAPKRAILPEDLELLVTLTDASVVPNPEAFECPVCMGPFEAYEGVILRDCFHSFCRECLASSIKHADDVVVRCPFQDENYACDSMIQDREIKSLLSEGEYNAYLGRSLQKAESLAVNSFHCKTPNCNGWCLVEDHVSGFRCPVCGSMNCLKCKAIHPNMGCEEYQDRLNGNYELKCSERQVQALISSGEAMRCPRCTVVVQKIAGCDFVACTVCKTGICWATRGPRWGPLGQGDTSGGCLCGVGGRKCHPSCRNCH
ncbi:hypothetical protein quinque_011136 [Culex quinquefasciatus]